MEVDTRGRIAAPVKTTETKLLIMKETEKEVIVEADVDCGGAGAGAGASASVEVGPESGLESMPEPASWPASNPQLVMYTKDGKQLLNPRLLGLAPKKVPAARYKPYPETPAWLTHIYFYFACPRPGLTGTHAERKAQQTIHFALECCDIHKALNCIPAALGKSPRNIATLLWELFVWPPNSPPIHQQLFCSDLAHAAAKCLKRSSLGPDCFEPSHPLYGNWSARAGNEISDDDASSTSVRGDGTERVGRGAYVLILEQFVHGCLRSHKWEKALSLSRDMLELDRDDDCGVRFAIPVAMLKLGMGLPTVKFCWDWLDELGGAAPLPAALGWSQAWGSTRGGGVVEGVDLELDMVQGKYHRAATRWPRMAFLVALGMWWMFVDISGIQRRGTGGNGNTSRGPPGCRSAKAWLRLGHKSNRHVLRILLTMVNHKNTFLGPTGYLSGQSIPSPTAKPGQYPPSTFRDSLPFPDPSSYEEASDFIYSTDGLFMDESREVPRWLSETAHALVANTCPGCRQKEARVGDHRACLGCRTELYCGVECQKKCWGRHKEECNRVRNGRKMRRMGAVASL